MNTIIEYNQNSKLLHSVKEQNPHIQFHTMVGPEETINDKSITAYTYKISKTFTSDELSDIDLVSEAVLNELLYESPCSKFYFYKVVSNTTKLIDGVLQTSLVFKGYFI